MPWFRIYEKEERILAISAPVKTTVGNIFFLKKSKPPIHRCLIHKKCR